MTTSSVVTRFAPSPTGFLHIGGARTALFNWLFTRHMGGKFLLRIEDTDAKRSTQEAIDAIFDGLNWLGLMGDEEPVFQSKGLVRHASVAKELVERGAAYYCYATPEELAEMREKAQAAKLPMRYDGRWRDRDPSQAPQGVKPSIRLKANKEGVTTIEDAVQGTVTVPNSEIDDMILLRSDGTPTYMLSVVVDDHDMGITHIIRGDDHLTNAFRQVHIYKAMNWDIPKFAHIPLIHGPDGAKLSKRHGALGVDAYRDMGYLPEAVKNYLLRLGWSHGDAEIISMEEAIQHFKLEDVNKGAARFDFKKLEHLNGHYIRQKSPKDMAQILLPHLHNCIGRGLSSDELLLLERAVPSLQERAKTLPELAESASFYFRSRPLALTDKAASILDSDSKQILGELANALKDQNEWTDESLSAFVGAFAEEREIKLGKIAQPIRAALTGSNVSPSVFEIMEIMGKNETLARLNDQV